MPRSSTSAILDRDADAIHFPYTIERGVRFPDEPMPLIGSAGRSLETREPLLVNEDVPAAGRRATASRASSGRGCRSRALCAPLIVGGEARGVISLQNLDRENAFSRVRCPAADDAGRQPQRGARERAPVRRDEAPADRDRRARGRARADQQRPAGPRRRTWTCRRCTTSSATRSRRSSTRRSSTSASFDFEAGVDPLPVHDRARGALPGQPDAHRGAPLTQVLLETRQPMLVNDVPPGTHDAGQSPVLQGEPSLSVLLAPLIAGGESRAASRSRTSTARTRSPRPTCGCYHARREPSVALENARLFDETKRRAAELAIVNNVQAALAAELDPQAMYELVGNRASDVFDTQVVDIAVFDHEDGTMRFPYTVERGRALPRRRAADHGLPEARPRDAAAAADRREPARAWPRARAARPDQGRAGAVGDLRAAAGGRRGPGQ